MLMTQEHSALLLIDVQQKLMPFIDQAEKVLARCQWTLQLAQALKIPILISEQYPKGLGTTLPELAVFSDQEAIPKLSFSSWREPLFKEKLHGCNKKQLILIGIETHVCVLQTALDLIQEDYQVFVVSDAVGSRESADHQAGLARMQQAGVEIVRSEMVFFEWIERAGSAQFKMLSQQFLK